MAKVVHQAPLLPMRFPCFEWVGHWWLLCFHTVKQQDLTSWHGAPQDTTAQQRSDWQKLGLQLLAQVGRQEGRSRWWLRVHTHQAAAGVAASKPHVKTPCTIRQFTHGSEVLTGGADQH